MKLTDKLFLIFSVADIVIGLGMSFVGVKYVYSVIFIVLGYIMILTLALTKED